MPKQRPTPAVPQRRSTPVVPQRRPTQRRWSPQPHFLRAPRRPFRCGSDDYFQINTSTQYGYDLSLFLSTETNPYGWPGSRPTSLTDPSGEIPPILVLMLAVLTAYALAIGIQWLAREVNPVFAFAICDVILSSIAVYFVALVFRLNPFIVTFSLAALAVATASVVCAQATQVNYNPQSGAGSNRSPRCAT